MEEAGAVLVCSHQLHIQEVLKQQARHADRPEAVNATLQGVNMFGSCVTPDALSNSSLFMFVIPQHIQDFSFYYCSINSDYVDPLTCIFTLN